MSEGSLQSDAPTFHVWSMIAQADQNVLLLTDKLETSSSATTGIQTITHHEELLCIPSTPPPATTICADTVTPLTIATLDAPKDQTKSPHDTLMPTKISLSTSSTEPNKRMIQPMKKSKTAKQLFPDAKQ